MFYTYTITTTITMFILLLSWSLNQNLRKYSDRDPYVEEIINFLILIIIAPPS